MTDAKPALPDPAAAALRDPRLLWTFVFAGFALVCFACTLVVVGDTAQRGFVNTMLIMSMVMFVTSGALKVGDASTLIKAFTGKG